jgi:hypothetical protein
VETDLAARRGSCRGGHPGGYPRAGADTAVGGSASSHRHHVQSRDHHPSVPEVPANDWLDVSEYSTFFPSDEWAV